MKLLQEASADDQFNSQVSKIETSLENLTALANKFEKMGIKPVRSQINSLKQVLNDLEQVLKLFDK